MGGIFNHEIERIISSGEVFPKGNNQNEQYENQ